MKEFRSHRLIIFVFICLTHLMLVAQTEKLQVIDKYIERIMRDWRVPGLAISIVKEDSVIFQKGFGVRNIHTQEPVDKNTIFQICSITKTFTASAIGLLVQRELLEWDDRVIDFLPEFRMNNDYVTQELKIRDLLCHRTGLPEYCLDPIVFYRNDYSKEEILERIAHITPAYGFRSSFEYTNATFMIAGEVIKAVTGQEWQNFVLREILIPLKMVSTFPDLSYVSNEEYENVAVPYVLENNEILEVPLYEFYGREAAGSLNSTVDDMHKWITIFSNPVAHDTRLIEPGIIEELTNPEVLVRPRGYWNSLYPGIKILTYGLGWFIYEFGGEKIIEHGGGSLGFRTTICIIPDQSLGFSILCNRGNSFVPEVIRYKILEIFFGDDIIDWNEILLKLEEDRISRIMIDEIQLENNRIPDTKPSYSRDHYSGIFENEFIGKISLNDTADGLILNFGDGQFSQGRLDHWHHDVFRLTWELEFLASQFVYFRQDENGRIKSLEIENFGVFKRI